MKEARYIDDEGDITKVFAKDIDTNSYLRIYKGNLYCEDSECGAELIRQETQKGGINRFFRTKPGSVHKSKCDNEINYEGNRARINRAGEKVNVSDSHIANTLRDAYKMYLKQLHHDEDKETEEEKPKRKRSKKKSPKTTGETIGTQTIGVAVATGGEDVEETKEPYIYKREVRDISNKDEQQHRELHSLIKDMIIHDKGAYINLVGIDGSESEIYIGEPFKTNSPNEFRLLNYIVEYVDELYNNDQELVFNGFVEVTKVSKPVQAQLYRANDFTINGKHFYQILRLTNKF